MTENDHLTLAGYIRVIADDFGLRDWRLYLDREPSDSGTNAQIRATPGQKVARIRVAWNFRDHDADDQRATIVHELLHCHLTPMQHILTYDMEAYSSITEDERAIMHTTFLRLMEYSVDGIADAIASKYPLIEWSNNTENKKVQ